MRELVAQLKTRTLLLNYFSQALPTASARGEPPPGSGVPSVQVSSSEHRLPHSTPSVVPVHTRIERLDDL